jgi:hypothetical protein
VIDRLRGAGQDKAHFIVADGTGEPFFSPGEKRQSLSALIAAAVKPYSKPVTTLMSRARPDSSTIKSTMTVPSIAAFSVYVERGKAIDAHWQKIPDG